MDLIWICKLFKPLNKTLASIFFEEVGAEQKMYKEVWHFHTRNLLLTWSQFPVCRSDKGCNYQWCSANTEKHIMNGMSTGLH